MRRNASPFISLLTLAIVLFGSVQFAHAGGLISRLLSGKKGNCRAVPKLRIFHRSTTDPCCQAPITICPPSYDGSDCPKQLLMMVSDVDENGNTVCVYRVFLAENCQNHSTLTLNLPCDVNEATCVNGQCGENGNQGLEGPFIAIMALNPIPIPLPGPGPAPLPTPGNPGTNEVAVTQDGVADGLTAKAPDATRQVIGVKATPVLAGYYQHMDGSGNTKFYALYRLSFVHNGQTKEAGVGFQIDAIPTGGVMLPGQWANVVKKTHRVDESDPSDPNKIVWTYVVHENQ